MTEMQQRLILEKMAEQERMAGTQPDHPDGVRADAVKGDQEALDKVGKRIHEDILTHHKKIGGLVRSEVDQLRSELTSEIQATHEAVESLARVRKHVEVVKWMMYNIIIIIAIIVMLRG